MDGAGAGRAKQVDRGLPSAPPTLVHGSIAAATPRHASVPLAHCHGKAADGEFPCKAYLALWPFIGATCRFAVLRPHQEVTLRVHADLGTLLKLLTLFRRPVHNRLL